MATAQGINDIKTNCSKGWLNCIAVLLYSWGFDNNLTISKIIICRKCNCFKRHKESEGENLTMSTQYQNYLDDMTSDGESEHSSSSSSSSSSENNLSELDDVDYYL